MRTDAPRHLRDALNDIDRIEAALFGDEGRHRERTVLVEYAAYLRSLALFEMALWDLCWHTGRSVTLTITGTHGVDYRLAVGGWSKEDGAVGEFVSGDLAELQKNVVAWADLVKRRKANEPLPEITDA